MPSGQGRIASSCVHQSRIPILNFPLLQASPEAASPLLRGTLAIDSVLEAGGAALALAAAVHFLAQSALAEFAAALMVAVILLASATVIGILALRPRVQPVSVVAVINAASGLTAFMLIAAGQVEPVSSVPLVAISGGVLLGVAGLLGMELRRARG
ncbi:MAG: hypothetical protein JNL34_05970 [Anaerolineae bacterium]|nr:hypothetical protein [Anaerolineae bacterium]